MVRPRARGCWLQRVPHPELSVDPDVPDETRLWAALQQVGGGTWGGCVFDVDEIVGAIAGATVGRPFQAVGRGSPPTLVSARGSRTDAREQRNQTGNATADPVSAEACTA